MKKIFKIERYDANKGESSYYESFAVEARPDDRILDCLNQIRWSQDPSLAYRMSCAHGVCGSDGMRIDGVCSIACQRLVKDYEDLDEILIEPLPNFPVLKDLVVSIDGFFQKYRSIVPYLRAEEAAPDLERLQSPKERAEFDEAVRCILCACCTAACPVGSGNEDFVGPAALLRSFRFLFDSRDRSDEERLELADGENHAKACKMHQQCSKVCPKEIPVSKSIGRIKRRIYEKKKSKGD